MSTDTIKTSKEILKTKKPLRDIEYKKPQLYHRPLRPCEKAYIYSYIEKLKPPHERDPDIVAQKYAF